MWQAEHARAASDPSAVPADDAKAPAALKLLRRSFQAQWTRLDKERLERTHELFTRCDELISRKQGELQAHQRTEEVAMLQKERDKLREDWLPADAAAAAQVAHPVEGAETKKLTSQQVLEKLRVDGAQIAVKPLNGPVQELVSESQTVEGKFAFIRVAFRPIKPDQTPMTAADYAILDSLNEVEQLTLAGSAVRDSIMEKLHNFHALKSLSLYQARPSPAGYAVLSTLPALTQLQIYDTGATAEAMSAVSQCRKLQTLYLSSLQFGDDALADLNKLPELSTLSLNQLDNLTSKAFAHLTGCRALKNVYASGFIVLSGMVENLGHCKGLETISLPNSELKDTEVAPLGELTKLRSLNLVNSPVTGSVFSQWRSHKGFLSLALDNSGGVDDEVCQHLEKAFPKIQDLGVKLAATGFTKAGATALGRLHELRVIRIEGEGVTDEIVDQLSHAANITSLSIPEAKLTDPGVVSLSHLAHLTSLSLDVPPITEAALKSFAHFKSLKTVNIGKKALPDTETKLETAVPGLVVHRPEG
jgi:Leucine-rich repeat (LRR) protein